MKTSLIIIGVLSTLPLAACGKSASDNLAGRVENVADARADALENHADMLDNQAAEIRKTGEQRSDAIDAANQNVASMSQAQRDAIVANQAAAVR